MQTFQEQPESLGEEDFYTARTDKSSSGSHLGLKGRETLLRLPVLAFLVCGRRAG